MLNAGDFLQNRYEIINCIGSGGMAYVYKARDHKLNRNVAIKVLKAEFSGDSAFVSKFRVEAQAAAGLAHPNIVNVYDVEAESGIYFIVMELVEGITLKSYILNKGRLTAMETIGICLQVAEGLDAAHRNRIIHRDVKPQNIIISKDGTVKVADFGIARAVNSDTIGPNVMGSVHYSAPEQSRKGYSDERSDIYSLGITMYEMLIGQVPFEGESTVEVALKHIQEEIVFPSDLVQAVPRALRQIITKCTQRIPAMRYQNMSQLIRDLKEAIINPNGDFVRIMPGDPDSATITYSKEDVAQIDKALLENSRPYTGLFGGSYEDRLNYPPENEELADYGDEGNFYDSFGDDYDVQYVGRSGGKVHRNREIGGRKAEKIITVLSIAAVILVGCVILYLVLHMLGLFGSNEDLSTSSSRQSDIESQQADEIESVPDIKGMSETDAQKLLRENNLGYKYLGEINSNDYTSGLVAYQDTDPGTAVSRNTQIGYKISIGSGQALTVPDVTDYSQDEAVEALSSLGLIVSVDNTRYSDSEAAGRVITTNPSAGSSIEEGDTITIYVSLGMDIQSVVVPDLEGKYRDDAITLLSNSGLYAYVAYDSSDTVNEGLVISQSVKAGTTVQSGSSITIIVSTGPEDSEDIVVINPDADSNDDTYNNDSGDGNSSASGTWICYTKLQAPGGYVEGQSVRITVEQNGIETTVFEGVTTFPYLLNVQGIAGVETGSAYVYILDSSGAIESTTFYDGIIFYEQD